MLISAIRASCSKVWSRWSGSGILRTHISATAQDGHHSACSSRTFFTSIPVHKEYDPVLNTEVIARDALPDMTPRQIKDSLDKHVVGQEAAKRSVAIAVRNRWRRKQIKEAIATEIVPKNILLVGPTGVGKTEIARRLAKLVNVPFVKTEATRYTEVGYHGADVDYMVTDLVVAAIHNEKVKRKTQLQANIEKHVEDYILRALLGPTASEALRDTFRPDLRKGNLDSCTIEVEVFSKDNDRVELLRLMRRPFTKMMTIKEARTVIAESETEKSISDENVVQDAIKSIHEGGIIFIDEIDKLIRLDKTSRNSDASDEGVQRDLLPLIEGSTVNTKYGDVKTDHILFICSGAFQNCKPSDLLPELQGRLPIQVQLTALDEKDFLKILMEPKYNLLRQQVEMMKTEGVELIFDESAVLEVAKTCAHLNRTIGNIGARRLHTVIERVMADISFTAHKLSGQRVVIDSKYVRDKVSSLSKDVELARYIL